MKKIFKFHNIAVTILVFVVIEVFHLIAVNTHLLAPLKEASKDFQFVDLVYSQIRDHEKIKPDDEIIIINAGRQPNRKMVSDLLRAIDPLQPSVIGIDIYFKNQLEPENDSLLAQTLSALNSKFVLVSQLDSFDKKEKKFKALKTALPAFNRHADAVGFFNLHSFDDRTIRQFAPKVNINGKDELAFAASVVQLHDKEAYKLLMKRSRRKKNSTEIINSPMLKM